MPDSEHHGRDFLRFTTLRFTAFHSTEIDGSMTTALVFRLARTNLAALAAKPGVCPASPRRELGTVEPWFRGRHSRRYVVTSSRGLDLLDMKTKCSADAEVEGPDPAA